MKLCMRKCEIVKKKSKFEYVYVMINKNYCVYVMLKKMWCVLDYLLNILQKAFMRFRLSQHYIEVKNVFETLELTDRPSGKFQEKTKSQIFDQIESVVLRWAKPKFPINVSVVLRWAKPKNHRAKIFHKKYRWFYGERHRKTTATEKKVSVVLPLTKPINDSKNSIGGFSVTSTDNSHRWFYRFLPIH